MSEHAIPPALARAGISSITDNLPIGGELDIARDAVRVFRGEIEARLLGWNQPLAPRRSAPAKPLHLVT